MTSLWISILNEALKLEPSDQLKLAGALAGVNDRMVVHPQCVQVDISASSQPSGIGTNALDERSLTSEILEEKEEKEAQTGTFPSYLSEERRKGLEQRLESTFLDSSLREFVRISVRGYPLSSMSERKLWINALNDTQKRHQRAFASNSPHADAAKREELKLIQKSYYEALREDK